MHLYHMLIQSERLRDNKLYTLNDLKTVHPDLYEAHVEKYRRQPNTLERRLPPLSCDWGDVVFLSPVHPEKVCEALARYRKRYVQEFGYHAIPVDDLDPAKLAIWMYLKRSFDPNEIVPFQHTVLEQCQDIPEATIAYFRAQRVKKQVALFFAHIPHVLHKGSIDMSKYPVYYTSFHEPLP